MLSNAQRRCRRLTANRRKPSAHWPITLSNTAVSVLPDDAGHSVYSLKGTRPLVREGFTSPRRPHGDPPVGCGGSRPLPAASPKGHRAVLRIVRSALHICAAVPSPPRAGRKTYIWHARALCDERNQSRPTHKTSSCCPNRWWRKCATGEDRRHTGEAIRHGQM